jgi:hypothetical protein
MDNELVEILQRLARLEERVANMQRNIVIPVTMLVGAIQIGVEVLRRLG